jgi:sulfur-oxidizing protein SoxY
MKNHPRSMLVSLLMLATLASAPGTAAPEAGSSWDGLQEAYYGGKKLEDAPFIRLTAPMRAASGDQVPFAFSIDHPMTRNSTSSRSPSMSMKIPFP